VTAYPLSLHERIVLVHLADQIDLTLLDGSNIKAVEALHEVPFAELVLDLRPDFVQLLVVTPVGVGTDLRESSDEDHCCENRLDNEVVRAIKVCDLAL
jgi:hypothetical protein